MRRTFWIVISLLLMALIVGSTAAQDAPPIVYCQGLSEADCALLTDSAVAMRSVHSAAAQVEANLSLSGIPNLPGEFSIRLSGNAAYTVSDPLLWNTLADPAVIELASTDPAAYFEQLGSLLNTFTGDASFTLFFSQELRSLARVSFFAVDAPFPDKVGFSARMVDGVGYVNLSKLAELDTANGLPKGWVGVDMAAALAQLSQFSGTSSGGGLSSTDQVALVQQYASSERLPDTTVDGQPAAVYRTTIDMGGLINDPAYQDMIEQAMTAQGQSLSKSEMRQAMQMIEMMIQGLQMNATQVIGLADKRTLESGFVLHWPIDLAGMMEAMGESSIPGVTTPLDIRIEAHITISQYDAVAPIQAPVGAQMMPLTG